MNKRPSIYIGSSMEALLASLKSDEDKVSSIINDIADKYAVIVEQCKPDLNRHEWLAICAAYNGHMFNPDIAHEVRAIGWCVSEWQKYSEAEAAQFDLPDNFRDKLDALGFAEKISIFHFVKVFWATGEEPI